MKKTITCCDDNGVFQQFLFDSSVEAYTACQCDEDITVGDLLIIRKEKIVALAWTWPVAITEEYGSLHSATVPLSQLYSSNKRVFSELQINRARIEASANGYPIR